MCLPQNCSEAQLNLVGRSTRDRIVAMNLDTLDFQQVPMTGFTGTRGDGLFNVVGFTGSGMEISGTELLYVTNFRPSVDPATGQVLPDQTVTGANATVEVFKVVNDAGTSALEWVRTIADDAVTTPNRVVAIPERGIYVTNDHGNRKTGIVSLVIPHLCLFNSKRVSPAWETLTTYHCEWNSVPSCLLF